MKRVLLDNNINYRFGRLLPGHEVIHVQDVGWEDLKNGDLLSEAERAGYDVLITADKNLRYQQNVEGRRISIVILNSLFIKWAYIEPLGQKVKTMLDEEVPPGSFVIVNPD